MKKVKKQKGSVLKKVVAILMLIAMLGSVFAMAIEVIAS